MLAPSRALTVGIGWFLLWYCTAVSSGSSAAVMAEALSTSASPSSMRRPVAQSCTPASSLGAVRVRKRDASPTSTSVSHRLRAWMPATKRR